MPVAFIAAILAAVLLAVVSSIVSYRRGRAGERAQQQSAHTTAEETSRRLTAEAEREAERIRSGAVVAGKEEVIRLREAWEAELRSRRDEVEREERRLKERDNVLD